MSQSAAPQSQNEQNVRPLDPNVKQRIASDPSHSAWVGASAGTGKTKVLTDRVLRLLLPRKNGEPGCLPDKIMCLTFTKAAAGEMALRVNETLSLWTALPDEAPGNEKSLGGELQKLLGHEATKAQMQAARRLFAKVIDVPGGLKIMTIHSFCQSVLGRFPLEAGLPPYFELLENDNDAALLLANARDRVIARANAEKGSPLDNAFANLAGLLNEEQFSELLKNIVSERRQFLEFQNRNFGADGVYAQICEALNIKPGQDPDEILKDACEDKAFDQHGLNTACQTAAGSSTKTDEKFSATVSEWLDGNIEKRVQDFEEYCAVFLTTKQTLIKKPVTKKVVEQNSDIPNIISREGERLQDVIDTIKAVKAAQNMRDLFILGHEIINTYQDLKIRRARLDYEDLIFYTLDLLEGRANTFEGESSAAWILYKLDQGIDHILVDEAQDTNPEQWNIIKALCTEFFEGTASQETTRTLFTVGDEKQSIYSFQRASPEEFDRMQQYFAAKAAETRQKWENVDINISFRSTISVLKAVDAVFAAPHMHRGLGLHDIKHHSFRYKDAGHVELWPLFEDEGKEKRDPWAPPIEIKDSMSGAAKLAAHIAVTVRSWLDNEEVLPSRGRAVTLGDIMIVLRTRTTLMTLIARALKDKNIPVSGVDRMVLSKELVIEDLIAFAEFALLPADDLTLACILKSPLIGMSEEELFELAHDRKSSLWLALKNHGGYRDITDYLSELITRARASAPYAFFSMLLSHSCPADDVSGLRAFTGRLGQDITDPLDEFLNKILDYERRHPASLQHFLHWQAREETEIKRQMEEGGQRVRIMTVHGAKGLQAPLVIMPDTTRSTIESGAKADKRLLWPDKTGFGVPLWSPRKELDYGLFEQARARVDDRVDDEYRRLLYVAMTRAEDRLYIGGYAGKKSIMENCWYNHIRAGLESLPDTVTDENGHLVLSNPQTQAVESAGLSPQDHEIASLPAWIYESAANEKNETKIFTPSKIEDGEPAATSPLQPDNQYRFLRGNLTHKLLEILPGLDESRRKQAAKTFLDRYSTDLPEDIRDNISEEIFKILSDPQFSPIFGPGSSAEVPVSGRLPDGRLLSGQIDRLLVTDKDIWIIDYKTNRPPPQNPEDVPDIYKNQLAAYAAALRAIYPGRTLHAALLWTDGPDLMPIDVEEA